MQWRQLPRKGTSPLRQTQGQERQVLMQGAEILLGPQAAAGEAGRLIIFRRLLLGRIMAPCRLKARSGAAVGTSTLAITVSYINTNSSTIAKINTRITALACSRLMAWSHA